MSIAENFDAFSEAVSRFEDSYETLSPQFTRAKSAAARKHLMAVSKLCTTLRKQILDESKAASAKGKAPPKPKKKAKAVEEDDEDTQPLREPDELDDFEEADPGEEVSIDIDAEAEELPKSKPALKRTKNTKRK